MDRSVLRVAPGRLFASSKRLGLFPGSGERLRLDLFPLDVSFWLGFCLFLV